MSLAYNEIMKFVNNIYYSKGKSFNEEYTAMWTREILNTKATLEDLHKAELRIIREDVPLIVNEVCNVIKECKPVLALPPKQKCDYCNGKGYVIGLKFENGIYTGYNFALNCVCGNAHTPNMLIMKEDISNNHKTPCKDGYYRIFSSVVEQFEYIEKLEKNNWRDIK